MEVKILNETKKSIKFEVKGVDHTFCNLLKDELWSVEGVTAAGYRIEHPQTGVPTFIVETDGKLAPKDALKKAASNMSKHLDAFKKKVLAELK